jgi:hypothetical protein
MSKGNRIRIASAREGEVAPVMFVYCRLSFCGSREEECFEWHLFSIAMSHMSVSSPQKIAS